MSLEQSKGSRLPQKLPICRFVSNGVSLPGLSPIRRHVPMVLCLAHQRNFKRANSELFRESKD